MISLDEALERVGTSLVALGEVAEAVILFGSRASGMESPNSDWDLLVVKPGQSRACRSLDLIFVTPEVFETIQWRQSELATHVGRWGRTLCGSADWLGALADGHIGDEAIERKRRRVLAQFLAGERHWPKLAPWARALRVRNLRRDLQRYERLCSGVVIPPSAILDHEWFEAGKGRRFDLVDFAGLRERAVWLEAELAEPNSTSWMRPRDRAGEETIAREHR